MGATSGCYFGLGPAHNDDNDKQARCFSYDNATTTSIPNKTTHTRTPALILTFVITIIINNNKKSELVPISVSSPNREPDPDAGPGPQCRVAARASGARQSPSAVMYVDQRGPDIRAVVSLSRGHVLESRAACSSREARSQLLDPRAGHSIRVRPTN